MKRYDFESYISDDPEMVDSEEGDYVLYQDVRNIIQAIRCAMNQRHSAEKIDAILKEEGL